MIDLTQQRIAEYEQFLVDLLEKLKVPEHPYTQEKRFNRACELTMSSILNSEEFFLNYFILERRMRELTYQYRRKLD